MSTRFKVLTALYFVALALTATGTVATDRPWSTVIAWSGFAIVAVLYVLLSRTPRQAKPALAEADPNPWGAVIEGIHEASTDELIGMWNTATSIANAGSAVQLDHVIRPAVTEELTAREIPLCRCGAPVPGGIHTRTCLEGS
jgi:hypothetical protein